jgi:diazepam-binding inhibitor (GABA receptor modulating acyl-CoA-binding protein)
MTAASTFRSKTKFMKSWKPQRPPSNRDRLELYALHKQSVSGDAPTSDPPSASVADKAKLNAWRAKMGLSQQDAMEAYVVECERQVGLYGTRDDDGSRSSAGGGGDSGGGASSSQQHQNNQQQHQSAAAPTSTQSTPMYHSTTPQNTPAAQNNAPNNNDDGVLLCPRGLAAIPLLCAAASESRSAYLARLQVTHPSNGWWAKQEPLCLEVNNPLSIPEKLIIGIACQIERISLVVSEYMGHGQAVSILSPRVLQAFLWPVHNVFLSIWILWILICTYLGSMVSVSQTLLFGAKRTNTPLGRLFLEEILPAARAVESLCEQHQTISVRMSGLALMPMMILCDVANGVVGRLGILVGSVAFVGMGACGWWYWLCVLPWLAVCSVCLAVMSGWCFGLIELSGN